jgi:hypothetical protein
MSNNDNGIRPKTDKNLIVKRRKFLIVVAAFALLGATFLAQSQAATNPQTDKADTSSKPASTCDDPTSKPAAPLTGYKLSQCEDFNGNGLPTGWSALEGVTDEVAGSGFTAARCSVGGGTASLTQDADGATCGLRTNFSQRQGYWEVRMRSQSTGSTGSAAYPQLILRPTDSRTAMNQLQYFGANIGQDRADISFTCIGNPAVKCFSTTIPAQPDQWHNYGLEWTASGLKGYVDGQLSYSTGTTGVAPDSGMHQFIQLGNISHDVPVKPAKMEVDWVHVYSK